MEWQPIDQTDFSGGVNWNDIETVLQDKEVADARNVRLTIRKSLRQRTGFTQYNATVVNDATTEIKSGIQFEDYSGSFVPVVQAGDGKLYKGDTALPGTGGAFTAIFTEGSSPETAVMDSMWGKLVATNNVDGPIVWEGTYGQCMGCKKTSDTNVNFADYSIAASDLDTSTEINIDALDSDHTDYLYIGFNVPTVTGVYITMKTGANVNTNTATATWEYCASGSWTTISTGYSDGTLADGKTFAQSGLVSWTAVTTDLKVVDGRELYWIRVHPSADLSATVRITGIKVTYNPQAMKNIPSALEFYPLSVKTTSTEDANTVFKDYTKEATDGAVSTVVSVGALTVTTGAIYIASASKFSQIKIEMSPIIVVGMIVLVIVVEIILHFSG